MSTPTLEVSARPVFSHFLKSPISVLNVQPFSHRRLEDTGAAKLARTCPVDQRGSRVQRDRPSPQAGYERPCHHFQVAAKTLQVPYNSLAMDL